MKVYLIGVGMGNADTLTLGAKRAIEGSDLLIGAPRLLRPFQGLPAEKLELVRSADIAAAIDASSARCASVLLSGDVGFYSGATLLYGKLAAHDVETVPGISSLVYFCAKLHVTWQDVELVSAHGREHNAVGAIQSHAKTFCITGGQTKVEDICSQLAQRGLGGLRVAAGERLSYDDERIVQGTAEELSRMSFADLSVMLALNENPLGRPFTAPSLEDGDFTRGAAPMTKEEVRQLAVCKLRIAPGHVVWDVGAGTGSVSVECALAASEGSVYAVERDPGALDVLRRTKEEHGACNLAVVEGSAPEALSGLPAPDRVFIGGSSGNLDGIVSAALAANPNVRFCATAVTLETVSRLLECLRAHGFGHSEIVQVAVARGDAVGPYHLMRAENPVYLVTFGNDSGVAR